MTREEVRALARDILAAAGRPVKAQYSDAPVEVEDDE